MEAHSKVSEIYKNIQHILKWTNIIDQLESYLYYACLLVMKSSSGKVDIH